MPVTQEDIINGLRKGELLVRRAPHRKKYGRMISTEFGPTGGSSKLYNAITEGDYVFTVWNGDLERVDLANVSIEQLRDNDSWSIDVSPPLLTRYDEYVDSIAHAIGYYVNIAPHEIHPAIDRGLHKTMPTFDPKQLKQRFKTILDVDSSPGDITKAVSDYLGPFGLQADLQRALTSIQEKPRITQQDTAGVYDTLGKELEENARIWKVFRKEATAFDQNVTLDEWNKTLDVLLLFAGLFSAIATSFVVQYAKLVPDDDGAATRSTPSSKHSQTAIRLWSASLVIALIDALLCILAKQWILEFNHRMSAEAATTRQWARRRWIYRHGFKKWAVAGFITQFLPLLLHVALFLFIVGLDIILWSFDRGLAIATVVLTCITFAFYAVCTLMPLWMVDFPTSTPLVRQLRTLVSLLSWLVIRSIEFLRANLLPARDTPDPEQKLPFKNHVKWRDFRRECLHTAEDFCIQQNSRTMEYSALRWLIRLGSSDDALPVAFAAVGALPLDSRILSEVRDTGLSISDAFLGVEKGQVRAIDITRAIRSELTLRTGDWNRPLLGFDIPASMLDLLRDAELSDARVLYLALAATSNIAGQSDIRAKYSIVASQLAGKAGSPPQPSTIAILVRCENTHPTVALRLVSLLSDDSLLATRTWTPIAQIKGGNPSLSDDPRDAHKRLACNSGLVPLIKFVMDSCTVKRDNLGAVEGDEDAIKRDERRTVSLIVRRLAELLISSHEHLQKCNAFLPILVELWLNPASSSPDNRATSESGEGRVDPEAGEDSAVFEAGNRFVKFMVDALDLPKINNNKKATIRRTLVDVLLHVVTTPPDSEQPAIAGAAPSSGLISGGSSEVKAEETLISIPASSAIDGSQAETAAHAASISGASGGTQAKETAKESRETMVPHPAPTFTVSETTASLAPQAPPAANISTAPATPDNLLPSTTVPEHGDSSPPKSVLDRLELQEPLRIGVATALATHLALLQREGRQCQRQIDLFFASELITRMQLHTPATERGTPQLIQLRKRCSELKPGIYPEVPRSRFWEVAREGAGLRRVATGSVALAAVVREAMTSSRARTGTPAGAQE